MGFFSSILSGFDHSDFEKNDGYDPDYDDRGNCDNCGGSGYAGDGQCEDCGGTGDEL